MTFLKTQANLKFQKTMKNNSNRKLKEFSSFNPDFNMKLWNKIRLYIYIYK